jgi:hypothetical protein
MKSLKTYFFAASVTGFLACGSLMAGTTFTVPDLPVGDVDTLSIQLNPPNGALAGEPGATVGWGFTVNWASTDGDWIMFTGSNLTDQGESNASLLALYTDFIGAQGGPVDFGLQQSSSPWIEAFNNVVSTGVGSYQIASGAVIGDQDTGEITFNFEVFNGDPTTSTQIGDLSQDYAYFGTSTEFSVNVAPEPNTGLLLAGALLIAALAARKRI